MQPRRIDTRSEVGNTNIRAGKDCEMERDSNTRQPNVKHGTLKADQYNSKAGGMMSDCGCVLSIPCTYQFRPTIIGT